MRFLFLLSVLWCVTVNAQVQFVSGQSWRIGDSTLVGTVEFYAKRNIGTANATPKEGAYWTTTRIIVESIPTIDYKAKYDSVVTEFTIFKTVVAKEIEALNRVIDSIIKPPVDTVISQPSPDTSLYEKKIKAEFLLSAPATVSAGLFKDGRLIKTLFNNKKYDKGSFTNTYNLLSDKKQEITDLTGYEVRTYSNNLKAKWEGVLGNTSTDTWGPLKHRGYKQIWNIAISGDRLFYSQLYSEGKGVQNWVDVNNIQSRTHIFGEEKVNTSQQTEFVVADDENAYWIGGDPFSFKHPNGSFGIGNWHFIFATKVSDNSEVIFPHGVTYKTAIGRTYKSVIDTLNNIKGTITGAAVQRRGRLLFIAHSDINQIDVIDKKTGEFLRTIDIEAPGQMAISPDDNYLWIITANAVNKYPIVNEAIGEKILTLGELEAPKSISVNDENVLIADAGNSQQVKTFSVDGALLNILGEYGGYFKSPLANHYKFYFTDKRNVTYPIQVYYQSDKSFWVVDGGNYRLLHFNADQSFKEEVMYIPNTYNVWADPINPGHVYANFMEFEVDYSLPLDKGWQLIGNWGANVGEDEFDPKFTIRPITFTNGRRYSLLRNTVTQKHNLVELDVNGLRYTGFGGLTAAMQIGKDLSIYTHPRRKFGFPQLFTKREFVGYDGVNPLWGPDKVIAKIPVTDSFDVGYSGQPFTLRTGEITDDGKLIVWDGGGQGSHYHLGAIKLGDTSFSFLAAKATNEKYTGRFPSNGDYDIGNGVRYAGGVALAIDSFITTGYHGEFWKQSQTNMWQFYSQDGLLLFQFGVVGSGLIQPAKEMAGNVLASSIVKVNGKYYLFHNDEGHHSGVHRWEISGMQSVFIQSTKPEFTFVPVDENINLTKDLPYAVVLNDSIHKWYRNPKTENYTDKLRDWWSVRTGVKSSDENDIYIKYNSNKTNYAEVFYDLGKITSDKWSLSGELNYDGNNPVATNNGASYFEILDANDNAILRMQPKVSGVFTQYLVNGEVLRADSTILSKQLTSEFQTLKVELVGDSLLVSFAGVSKTVAPLSSSFTTPQKVRFRFFMTQSLAAQGSAISFRNLIFKK